MKKILLFVIATIIILSFSSITLAYSNDYYSVDDSLYSISSDGVFKSNNNKGSSVSIHTQPITLDSYYTYETLFNEDNAKEFESKLLTQFKELSSDATITQEKLITDLAYPFFVYTGKVRIAQNTYYYFWYYLTFSDNNRYDFFIFSSDVNYVNYNETRGFINSFKINDTTNIQIPTSTANTNSTIINEENTTYYNNSNHSSFSTYIVITIVLVLVTIVFIIFSKKKKH